MGRRLVKFNGKSGLLPKPKEIFKQPYKHQVYNKPEDTGYAEGILHPSKITRDYIIPKVVSPDTLLSKSAKEPKKVYSSTEISQMPIHQQFKVKNSEMRRKYLKESYEHEVQRLETVEKYEKLAKIEQEKIKIESSKHEQSKAEFYTAPTIESYLNGPLVRKRTPEEEEELRIKRESNRLQTQLNVDIAKADNLLKLYNDSSNFAITEEKLNKLVDAAFDDSANQKSAKVLGTTIEKINTVQADTVFNASILDVVVDNVNRGPGYESVEDYLTGFNNDIRELAEQIKKEKNEEALRLGAEKMKQAEELSKNESN